MTSNIVEIARQNIFTEARLFAFEKILLHPISSSTFLKLKNEVNKPFLFKNRNP